MKVPRYFPLFALLFLSACTIGRKANLKTTTSETIFRHVNLGLLGQFELGKPFGDYKLLSIPEGPRRYRLRDEAFGGAEAIVVTTDKGGTVRRIHFEYGPDYDYATKLREYTESLGPPWRKKKHQTIWNDGRTAFTLTQEAGKTYASQAEMRDLVGDSF